MPNNLDNQYINLCKDILGNGIEKETRNGKVLSVFGRTIRHNMKEGFPLLTTKKMYFKGVIAELLWFLQGRTDLRYLLDHDCHIWDGDAYKNYEKEFEKGNAPGKTLLVKKANSEKITHKLSIEDFILLVKTDDEFAKKWGSLGPIYGAQWRNWKQNSGVYIDQINNLINELKINPDSRRLLVSAWNVGEINDMVLPPCHYGFQIYTQKLSLNERYQWLKDNCTPEEWITKHYNSAKTKEYFDNNNVPERSISLMFNMRSVDVPLGLPFNLASYGLLLEIIAKIVNMVPEELIANLGDTHIYLNQIPGIKEQITRDSYRLATLEHLKTDEFYNNLSNDLSLLSHLEISDFSLSNYLSKPIIKIPLSN